jgi:hypothetical protein
MDEIAMGIGYIVMGAGSVVVLAYLLGIACNYVWRKLRDAHGLYELIEAHREYKKRAAAQEGK